MSNLPSTYSFSESFLCGPHPLRPGREILESLLASGITCFIDLTEPGEVGGRKKEIGKRNKETGIRKRVILASDPYFPIPDSTYKYLNFPIPDYSIPTPEIMTTILDALDAVLAEGHTVYLHCHGGRGRTGTVVGCWLVRHGMTGEQGLARIAELRGDHESPETKEQRAYVMNWKVNW